MGFLGFYKLFSNGYQVIIIKLFNLFFKGNLIAIQDVSIILVKVIIKFALNVILLCNFCKIINVLNPMNVKKVINN